MTLLEVGVIHLIKVENVETFGWESAIRGMRNPLNSWDKSDSDFSCDECIKGDETCYYKDDVNHLEDDVYDHNWCNHTKLYIGPADLKLMRNLARAGSDHAKYLRMINVTVDITAPLFWWKEFDTYKVGTVANSCSTMHKIMDKEFTADDFSWDTINKFDAGFIELTVETLNEIRDIYINYDDYKKQDTIMDGVTKNDVWRVLIEMLPSSYNQRRTVQMNYQVLWNMYNARKNHKLHEWLDFCKLVETLPYFKEIFGIDDNVV